MANITKEALERWQAHVEFVQSVTTTSANVFANETKAEQLKRKSRAVKDYNFFVQTYFPHYCTDKATGQLTPCASFHIKAAKFILDNPQLMAIFMWPRGHAKSTHMGVFIPMWLKIQPTVTLRCLALAGKSEDSAIRLLSDLQAELQYNQLYEHDFGRQYKAGSWAVGEFTTMDGTSFHAIGRGQSPRGLRDRQNRPDYIICDDLDDDELSRNPARVEAAQSGLARHSWVPSVPRVAASSWWATSSANAPFWPTSWKRRESTSAVSTSTTRTVTRLGLNTGPRNASKRSASRWATAPSRRSI